MNRAFLIGLALWSCGLAGLMAADVIETFDNGTDNGDWHLTSNPLRSLSIQPSGGDPGSYLRGEVESATPTWYVPSGTTTDFLGNYYDEGITKVSVDINIFVGNNEPNRTLTLDLISTFGTGDSGDEVEAYYIGPNISNNKPGWVSYEFPLNARSKHIPNGWTVLRGGEPGKPRDWRSLMHDVETMGFVLGQPGFAYTDHTVWDLGIDNPRLVGAAVPEPGSVGDMILAAFGAGGFIAWKRRQKNSGCGSLPVPRQLI